MQIQPLLTAQTALAQTFLLRLFINEKKLISRLASQAPTAFECTVPNGASANQPSAVEGRKQDLLYYHISANVMYRRRVLRLQALNDISHVRKYGSELIYANA